MLSNTKGSALWPVILGMATLLVGAIVLETAGRNREQRGDVIVISSVSGVDSDEGGSEDAPLWSAPLNEQHAQARRLVRRGQYSEASKMFKTLLQNIPDKPELLAELGYVQLISGDSKEAESTLLLAQKQAPNNAWLTLTLASASKRTGNATRAETMYREALRIRPHYRAAKLAFGRFLRQSRREEDALVLLLDISSSGSNENRATALTELGRTYLALDRPAEAEVSFESAIGRAPASVPVRMAIARGYIDSGTPEDLEKATTSLRKAIQLAPAVAQLQSLLGVTLIERGDKIAGKAAFLQSLELDPGYVYARRRILRLELNAGDYPEARVHAQYLLTIDDKNSEYYFLAALVDSRDSQWAAARRGYGRAIELADGNYPEAFMNLGKLERRKNNYDGAILQYRKALELRPGYREAWNNLGLVLLASGQQVEALSEFETLVLAHPKYPEAWLNKAKAHAATNNYNDAILSLRRALELRPSYSSAQLNLASILRKSGQPAEAVDVYDKILIQQPRYVSAWYNRGIALEAAKQPSDARTSYEEAVRLDPHHLLSLKRLARLELREGKFSRSEELYTEILDQSPSDSKSRRLRGESRAGQDDRQGCLDDATIAQKQDPNNSNLERLFAICNNDEEVKL